ncbi:hypothetical protein BDV37DRAFT_196548 [Aspergillus pseudonomiae]|uniref:Uncharacterized protein n=1 Tax=Aspergillus pseudonomiae TaxID=1506151 RepID=A0A5N7D316_9EURO|nr:uncharacterized protein BDV37DRAFT_196548 [Aspergillus pseudonomiae]KAE8400795.1 hypothetical protein BDV37DRAFT_196548 [Aspergillus pseudonomiae]
MVTLHTRPAVKGRDWPIDQHTRSTDDQGSCNFYEVIARVGLVSGFSQPSSLLPTREPGGESSMLILVLALVMVTVMVVLLLVCLPHRP